MTDENRRTTARTSVRVDDGDLDRSDLPRVVADVPRVVSDGPPVVVSPPAATPTTLDLDAAAPDAPAPDDAPPAIAREVAGRPPSLDQGLELVSVVDGPLFAAAEEFLYEIYRASEFCRESPRHVVEELQPWRHASVFHLVVDEHQEILGSVRTIHGRFADLPVGAFDRTDHRHADPLCELSSLAVRPSVRSSGIVEHIYRAGWLAAFRAGASALVGLVDPWLFEMFVDYYGLPFEPFGEQHFHMGGNVVPVAMPLTGADFAGLASSRPDFWSWTLEACSEDEIARWGLPPAG